MAALISAPAVIAAISEFRQRQYDQSLLHGLPLIAFLTPVLMAISQDQLLVTAIGNIYALALSIALIAAGLGARSLRQTNLGLCAISLLFILRFVDSNLSLVARGLAMVMVGVGFVAVNLWLLRRQKELPSSDPSTSHVDSEPL